ncbi:MAG: Na+/H+ antiporter NhaA [Proteobacteria bacterium]|nr:Na+/H+ antiporter NhaA [Pseudomonadota bacterium]
MKEENAIGFLSSGGWSSNEQRYSMLREMEIATRKSLTPLERFETELHPWMGFAIMPVFALANAGVAFEMSDFSNPVAIAVVCGLFFGKPLGVVLFSWLAVKMGLGRLPEGVSWPVLIGGSFLTGIGFTMALFISSLALEGEILDAAKVGVLGGSLLSAVVGMVLLSMLLPGKAGR